MVEQVRLSEVVGRFNGSAPDTNIVFAFGAHPMATEVQAHPVTRAQANENRLRIIVDELLRGNDLEEIECRGVVDDDDFDRVPVGATPDDVARCSAPQDLLASRCPASNPRSFCLCKNEGGCAFRDKDSDTDIFVPTGQSVGVRDEDHDGAADNTQFIKGAVRIVCGRVDAPIDVALDLDLSYWNPSGDQQVPAMGGFDALGPAIVLKTLGALPTSAECGVVFSPDIIDKDGNPVCAPMDGDIANGCEPGDTSAIKFSTEELAFVKITTSAMRTKDVVLRANVPLDAASLINITIIEGMDTVYTDFRANLGAGAATNEILIQPTAADGQGFAPNTVYKITVPTTVTDAYHQGAAQPVEISFTTGAL